MTMNNGVVASNVVTSSPVEEPLTLGEAKLHLRMDHDADDTLIAGLISTAREHAEAFCRRPFVSRNYAATFSRFPDLGRALWIPMPGVTAVASVTYANASNVTIAMIAETDYRLVRGPTHHAIELPYNVPYWPWTANRSDAITVTYTAGYGYASDVPRGIKSAMLLLVGHLYENREAVSKDAGNEVPIGLEPLLFPYRSGEVR
jgi:uncharacterized phiE125 gp8 family phage protein